jgi:lambda family phage tail tape measure protein
MDALAERQRVIAQGYADMASAESNWLNGARSAWEDWLDNVNNVAGQVKGIATSAIDGFVTTTRNQLQKGQGDWKGYLDNVNAQILDFIIKQQLTKFLKYAGEALKGTDLAAGATTFFGSLFGSEKGNVFAGAPGLAAYRNTIVSAPTIFPFQKGGMPNLGIMGERAGRPHEAIMPLTRTQSGDLGVHVKGGGDTKVFNYNQTLVVPGVPNRSTQDQIASRTLAGATRAARRS